MDEIVEGLATLKAIVPSRILGQYKNMTVDMKQKQKHNEEKRQRPYLLAITKLSPGAIWV